MFDHTDFAGTTYTHSNFLNGGYNSQVGLSKSIKVYPGDVIHAEVYAKYWNQSTNNSNLTAFAAALTAAFGVSASSVGEGIKAYNALNNFGAGIVAVGGSGNTAGPKAFITVLLYDKNYNFVDVTYKQINPGNVQTGTSTKAAFDLMTVDKTVVEPGYAFIYISNEDPHLVDVYFDDLTITQTKTNVLQYNEYYPFGLQTQNSWTRENSTGNNFLANGATELNTTSSLYDLAYRNYDPILGRFGQVDPLADKYGSHTPYNYAFNDPVFFNDPSGASSDCPVCEHNYQATYASQWSRNPWSGRPARMDDGWNPNFGGPVTMGFIDGKVVYGTPTQVAQAIEEINSAIGHYSESTTTIGGEPYVWNNWAGWVKAKEILSYSGDISNQKWYIRYAALIASFSSSMAKRNNGTCPTCLDPSTVGRNAGLSYPGPFNPMTYPDANGNRRPDYTTVPKSLAEYPAIGHDRRYDNLKISGFWGLVSDTRAIGADWQFVSEELELAFTPYFDPVTRLQGAFFGTVLGGLALTKTIIGLSTPQSAANVIMWYQISNIGVTNAPTKTGK